MKSYILTAIIIFPKLLFGNDIVSIQDSLLDNGYVQIGEEEKVRLYKKENIGIIALAGEMEYDHPPEILLQQVIDYDLQQEMIGQVSKCDILDRGPGWIIVYHRLNLPIINDRDYTLQVDIEDSSKIKIVRYNVTDKLSPPKKEGVIRLTCHKGIWQIKPTEKGKKCLVRFQVFLDMAGWLPVWLTRIGAISEFPDLFIGINNMIEFRKKNPLKKECPVDKVKSTN